MVGGAALDRGCDDLACALVGLLLGPGLDLLDLQGRFMRDLGLNLRDQVFLGLVGGQAGDALEHLGLAALDGADFLRFTVDGGVLGSKRLLLLLDRIHLVIEVFLFLLQSALLLLDVGAAFLDFLLVFVSGAQDIFLCLQHDFAFLVFSALDRFVDNTKSLFIGVGDLLLGALSGSLANPNTKKNANDERPHRDKRSVEIADHAIPPVCFF